MAFDPTTEAGKKVVARLETEQVIWHVTVSPEGEPRPVPVWFLWDDGSLTMYSKHDNKVQNIEANPRGAMHLNSDRYGGEIVILYGTFAIDETVPDGQDNAPYMAKYADGIKQIAPDVDPETFFKDYSIKLRFTINDANVW